MKRLAVIKSALLISLAGLIFTCTPLTAFADTAPATPALVTATPTTPSMANSSTPASPQTTVATTTTTTAAQSGDAAVTNNQTGGNATTGTATATATTVAAADSTITNGTNNTLGQFTQNISGNQVGDISLNTLTATPTTAQSTPTQTVTNQGTSVQNSVAAAATSGNATVSNNGQAGNAVTGTATAGINNATIVSSTIASPNSFIGTINIYGTLTGDIMVAPNYSPSLITSSSPAVNADNTTITNAVSLDATSGNATVSNNGQAGNAQSGNAATGLTVYNVVGQGVSGTDSLIVLVNVVGAWSGNIIDAPAGSTTAFLGTNVVPVAPVKSNTPLSITNTLSASAQSGDASVIDNGSAGNAQSGNANAVANVLTIARSNLQLSRWFGIIFINVFGTWLGSFGINTPYGDPPAEPTTAATPSAPFVTITPPTHSANIPPASRTYPIQTAALDYTTPPITATAAQKPEVHQVLGAMTTATSQPISQSSNDILALGVIIFGLIILLGWIIRKGYLSIASSL